MLLILKSGWIGTGRLIKLEIVPLGVVVSKAQSWD